MNNITTVNWSNELGSRSRLPLALIVLSSGECRRFCGESIPGVCRSTEVERVKNGKWSHSVFRVDLIPGATFLAWSQDFNTGSSWPHVSWDAALAWVQSQAPAATLDGLKACVRAEWPKSAAKLDVADQPI